MGGDEAAEPWSALRVLERLEAGGEAVGRAHVVGTEEGLYTTWKVIAPTEANGEDP